jgi:GNAT superfamily N-acetyltransferase
MLLRRARLEDLHEIYDVRQSATENRLYESREVFLEIARPLVAERLCWVCEARNGRIVGFGAVDAASGAIDVLYVRPDMEGRGIGKGLLRKCCDDLLLRGHRLAWLTTGVDTRAEGFYRKLGWRSFPSKTHGEVLFRRSLMR